MNFVPTNVVESMADGSMVPCIVFAIFFGVAMGAYTRQSGNRNMADWVIGLNKVITNIIKTVMYIAPDRYLLPAGRRSRIHRICSDHSDG